MNFRLGENQYVFVGLYGNISKYEMEIYIALEKGICFIYQYLKPLKQTRGLVLTLVMSDNNTLLTSFLSPVHSKL